MSETDDKGRFETDIAQSVIDEALKSVEKHVVTPAEGLEAAIPAAQAGVDLTLETPPAAEQTPAEPPAIDPRDVELMSVKNQLSSTLNELTAAQEIVRQLNAQYKDEHEKMLRASADLENYRRRAAKEKEEVQKYGLERLLRDFFPVYDNFDRALEHAKGPDDFDSLKKGVEMMRKLFVDTLGKHGVKIFAAKGLPFDPMFHEAMGNAETNEMPPNHVASEILSGFMLNERMVRPALVMVSKPVTPKKKKEGEAGEASEKPAEAQAEEKPAEAKAAEAKPEAEKAPEEKPAAAKPGADDEAYD